MCGTASVLSSQIRIPAPAALAAASSEVQSAAVTRIVSASNRRSTLISTAVPAFSRSRAAPRTSLKNVTS